MYFNECKILFYFYISVVFNNVYYFRNIKGSDEEVSNAIEMLKTNGFINYYGLQRFGSSVVSPTYVVGKSLACGNVEEVNSLTKLIFISNCF